MQAGDEIPDSFSFPLSPEDRQMVTVERKEVALLMIETAASLWFRELDMVSEHLLAASAANILKGVGKTRGVTSHAFNKEMEAELGKKLRLAMNFFKHADSDPDHVLRFAPVVNEFFLIDAVQMYGKLYHSLTPLMHTFRARFMVDRGRHVGTVEQVELFLPNTVKLQDVVGLSRLQFMKKVYPLFAAQYPQGGPV